MKRNCRIIISQACNYKCSYCCNKVPGTIDRFVNITEATLMETVALYDSVCLTGGEPLLPDIRVKTSMLVSRIKSAGKKVFIYTNLSYLPTGYLVDRVDGWSIGFHPKQTNISDFVIRVLRLKALGAKNIRVLAENSSIPLLEDLMGRVQIKGWEMDKFDKTDIEDWYKISNLNQEDCCEKVQVKGLAQSCRKGLDSGY